MNKQITDSWEQRKRRSKREIESGRFLRELLNLPNTPSKRAFIAQSNPLHYILVGGNHGLPQ